MKKYFGYIRVSTVRQGEKGSSLQEQRSAIEAYARRNSLSIIRWFEEMETAAKQGRPVFDQLLKALAQRQAGGIIVHKIDRSARNLRDWAALGELHDRGIELHFAHESLDFNSRGGRLSADIQAVVAADYIRNLRDEIRKGFYGRLKQGFYPLPAPIGYLDRGGGVAKTIDPLRGPLVVKAFELYAEGGWSLDTLGEELHRRGLSTQNGRRISRSSLATMLHNPFYFGVIRIERSGETFQGAHPPLIDKFLFDRVQSVLDGRSPHKTRHHAFRYQRVVRCSSCKRTLAASRHKGCYVYYRCQTKRCPTTCVRQELLDDVLFAASSAFAMTKQELADTVADIDMVLSDRRADSGEQRKNIALAIAAIDDRVARLTDAYIDRLIDREACLSRKEGLLEERTALASRAALIDDGSDAACQRARRILELVNALGNMADLKNDDDLRRLLKETTSNFLVSGKNVEISWQNPFRQLSKAMPASSGGAYRTRTDELSISNGAWYSRNRFRKASVTGSPEWARSLDGKIISPFQVNALPPPDVCL